MKPDGREVTLTEVVLMSNHVDFERIIVYCRDIAEGSHLTIPCWYGGSLQCS